MKVIIITFTTLMLATTSALAQSPADMRAEMAKPDSRKMCPPSGAEYDYISLHDACGEEKCLKSDGETGDFNACDRKYMDCRNKWSRR